MIRFVCIILSLFCTLDAISQRRQDSVLVLTLEKAIEIARVQSPDARYARHRFRSQYWNYCYYKANYKPSLNFSSNPSFNHSINAITLPDATLRYMQQNNVVTDAVLSLTQNITLTGGSLSLQTSLQRMDMLSSNTHSYRTNPLSIVYQQSLTGHNSLKWDRKIEPIRFEEAKKNYVETMELVASRVIQRFFNLAQMQTNLNMAKTNYAHADTLYAFAKRRYDIGTITESELLQLEISRLNEESNLLNNQNDLDDYMQNFRTFLGINEALIINVDIDFNIPTFTIDIDKAIQLAFENHPRILASQRSKLESESNVTRAKANAGLRADIYAQFGLTQTGDELDVAYKKPLNQQYVSIGIRLPILDWGRGKGSIRMAESSRDLIYAQEEQNMSDFEQDVVKIVKQFNLQNGNVMIATKMDQTAERNSEVSRKLYLLGKLSVTDLNTSVRDKDNAKRKYINSLYDYWRYYYMLRNLTLYDFEKGIALTEDYEALIK